MRLLWSKMLKPSLNITVLRHFFTTQSTSNIAKTIKYERFTSKQVRELFLKYFITEKDHTYIHSSPVFLNNDPSLLFVNAGMNQFRSVLLNKTYPGHPFHGLKRVANSQKCVRLSGKHNDLKDVGVDLYHHTFFEMLGNWSFGNYSKMDACKMAWELLTTVYGLDSQNLYVTYFGGDAQLGILPDEECKRIWLEIGVPMNHIFPFGAKDNFWEMGDTGPCGPCTEIHYDFKSSGPDLVAKKINADSPDVMEIWNLVFIQYTKDKGNVLRSLPTLHVDTGMGFERICAVLQGTQSNYDTDVFQPIFHAIKENFKVRSYQGQTGSADIDGFDTAYRVLADHSRMFSISIADGLFPDNYDAGFVLRKIIRRAAYTANCMFKTKPGTLSSLVPCVAETLDFFPEVNKHINEIIYVVNEEEKMFHQVINKGRKARNKMISDNPKPILDGHQAFELHVVHGLEANVVQDLASEINYTVDWDGYEKAKMQKLQAINKQQQEKSDVVLNLAKSLEHQRIPLTDDSFKYDYMTEKNNFGVKIISAKVLGIVKDSAIISEAENGNRCILVTNKTNFYSEAGGQLSDIGKIYNKDFTFNVEQVTSSNGYVFHHGVVTEGKLKYPCDALMDVDKDHRLSCTQNHTATHILNSALRRALPYTAQRTSFVGPTHLRFGFSAKSQLAIEQMEEIEKSANALIQQGLKVSRRELKFEELLNHPKAILLRGEEYPETVSVISIGNDDKVEPVSIEPCCGTHVHNTADIETLVLIPSKAHGGSTKIISAVSGKHASVVKENDIALRKRIFDLKKLAEKAINEFNSPIETYQDLLKQVKQVTKECHLKYDVSLLQLNKYQEVLKFVKLQLTDVINSTSKVDVNPENSNVLNQEPKVSQNVIDHLKGRNILPTDDSFKYEYINKDVKPISAKVLAIVGDGEICNNVKRGLRCQIILDKSNFYVEDDDQAGDAGILSCENFVMKVNSVYKEEGLVFHDGFVEEGNAVTDCSVNLLVNQEHRLACSQNHTALHLLISALKVEFPYVFPQTALAGPKELQLTFTAKDVITDDNLRNIEKYITACINANLNVTKSNAPLQSLTEILPYKTSLIKKCKEHVPVVTIESPNESILKSSEPCSGTHVASTADIGSFVIIAQKSNSKTRERTLRAVTGNEARDVKENGESYHNELTQLEEYVNSCLKRPKVDCLELWDCLKKVKEAKVFRENELPLLLFRDHQNTLSELTIMLTQATSGFVQMGFQKVKSEMEDVLKEFSDKKFIIHMLSSVGDGKKIINYALDNSGNKPCLYFVKDGHNSIICSCSVPKSVISPTFNALLWINPVAALLEGKTRKMAKDPELLYSVLSSKTERVDQATSIAKEFINSHLGCS